MAAADPAALKLTQLVRSKDEGVALRAATAVLDRVGLGRDFSNGPAGPLLPASIQADLVLEFIEGVLSDLSIALTEQVRAVVGNRLRAMSLAQQRAVAAAQPAAALVAG